MAAQTGITPKLVHVAAIDFGTTHCSVAYLIRPDVELNSSDVEPFVRMLNLDSTDRRRVQICILFDPSGNKIAFRQEARHRFAALRSELRPQHHYFEHVKKNLQHEKNIDRSQRISDVNGKQFFLVDVIAHVLHHFKNQLLTVLRDFGYRNIKASMFNWVITVPAIWGSSGRKMMYEAGYMAGLTSDSEPPPICIATGVHYPSPKEEESPEKLSLVSESESAATHCLRKAIERGRGSQYLGRASNYLLVDIGGATVDIASHKIVDGHIKEIVPPVSNSCGGTIVNEEFSKFLQDFVDDPKFSRYMAKCSPETQTRHQADLNELLYIEFETQKIQFGSGDGGDSYRVQFPRSFVKQYKDSLVEKGRALSLKGDISIQVEDDGAVMLIEYSKMAEIFQPAVDRIANLLEAHMKNHKIACTIDIIYCVGGFGGCEYLHKQLEAIIRERFLGCRYYFPIPPNPALAVILGATALHCISMDRKPGVGGSDPTATLPQHLTLGYTISSLLFGTTLENVMKLQSAKLPD